MDVLPLGFSAALLLGLGFGAGLCNIACFPYLAPIFISAKHDMKNSMFVMLPFSLGRMTGYTMLGAVAGWAGLMVEEWIQGRWVRLILGGATIIVALSILSKNNNNKKNKAKKKSCSRNVEFSKDRTGVSKTTMPGGLFMMGIGMALNPCAPLTTIIVSAATTASVIAGSSMGFGFGIGAVIVPTFIFAVGVAHFGSELHHHISQWSHVLMNISIGLLLIMGVGTIFGWVAP